MRHCKTLFVFSIALAMSATGCCRQCNLCHDVGGPCGVYSTAHIQPERSYHVEEIAPQDSKAQPKVQTKGEEKLIPELERLMRKNK